MKKKTILDFLNGKNQDIIKKIVSDGKLSVYIALFLFSSVFLFLSDKEEGNIKKGTTRHSPLRIDTMIPSNQSLVPISIEMSEKLDSIIGQYARVNLFLISPHKKNRLVAESVKLLRSPKNPSVFAVLVPHRYVKWFMSLEGRFLVSITSSGNGHGTFLVKENTRRSKIHYGVKSDPIDFKP